MNKAPNTTIDAEIENAFPKEDGSDGTKSYGFEIKISSYAIDKEIEKEKKRQAIRNHDFAWYACFLLIAFMLVDIFFFMNMELSNVQSGGIIFLQALFIYILAKGCGATSLDDLVSSNYISVQRAREILQHSLGQ